MVSEDTSQVEVSTGLFATILPSAFSQIQNEVTYSSGRTESGRSE